MKITKIGLLSIALIGSVYAADIELAGTREQLIQPSGNKQFAVPRKIKLMNIRLSEKAVETLTLKTRITRQAPTFTATSGLPAVKQLGMNNVPVLDQGQYGTCVTFASTAAIDAALGKGDYISQLCLLQLGNYEQQNAYRISGWDGSFNRFILGRLEDHGFISKETEQSTGCGDLKEYPQGDNPIPSSEISFDEYHNLGERLSDNGIFWAPILDIYKSMTTTDLDSKSVIDDIKRAINRDRRVVIGSFLPAVDLGVAGAVGTHHETNDTWVLSTVIEREIYLSHTFFAGHALIITGYDDDAIAIDNDGRKHRGLFTLRNSWGEFMGDKGDFYMSYDYFRVLGLEADEIMVDDAFHDVQSDENNKKK